MARTRQALTPYGAEVKKNLIDREMTQVELAELVGCSKQYINKILHGQRSGQKYIDKISDILNIKTISGEGVA